MLSEKFTPPFIANNSLSLKLICNNSTLRLKFEGSFLKQEEKTPFTPNSLVNLISVYELGRWSRDVNADFTLKKFLFRAVNISKNADPDKCIHTGYGIGFDSRSEFSLPDGSMGKNITIFPLVTSSSAQIDDKKKDILILVEGPTQRLNDTMSTAEAQSSINSSRNGK